MEKGIYFNKREAGNNGHTEGDAGFLIIGSDKTQVEKAHKTLASKFSTEKEEIFDEGKVGNNYYKAIKMDYKGEIDSFEIMNAKTDMGGEQGEVSVMEDKSFCYWKDHRFNEYIENFL